MKKLVLIVAASFMMTLVFAKIPAKITNLFHLKYGGATNVKWKNNVINYTVTFNLLNAKFKAIFDKKGEWLLSTKTLQVNELPDVVNNGLKKTKYAGWKIMSSYEEYFPKDPPRFHLRTYRGGSRQRKNLVFDSQGNLVQNR